MPNGKVAGELCANLDPVTFKCSVWGTKGYPEVCRKFTPSQESCGGNRQEAMVSLNFFEVETDPRE
jgi:hypothetical protein